MPLARVQAASGLLFAIFLILHLATTASAVGGPAAYDAVLRATRLLYRPHAAVEILLVGVPAIVHVVCAVLRIRERRHRPEVVPPSGTVRVHRWTGYFLLAVIVGHVLATRVMPAQGAGPADLGYLAYSVLGWPFLIGPYYVLLGAAGAVHLGLGVRFAANTLWPGRVELNRAGLVLVAGVMAGVVAILAYASSADRSRFGEFEALYRRFVPFLLDVRR